MNTKNKLIEKLLKGAKKHKILTYPVLALVAVISVFNYLFSWSTGAGKRVVAVVMVLVLFVSQSYFLTSSATALVDTEESLTQQQELQEQSLIEEDFAEEDSDDESDNPLIESDDVSNEDEEIADSSESLDTSEEMREEEILSETETEDGDSIAEEDNLDNENLDENDEFSNEDDETILPDVYEDDYAAEVPEVSEDEQNQELSDMDEPKDEQPEETIQVMCFAYNESGGIGDVGTAHYAVKNDDGTYRIPDEVWADMSGALDKMNIADYVLYDGWYTKMDASTQTASGTHITSDNRNNLPASLVIGDSIRLYAQKTLLRYEVTLDGNQIVEDVDDRATRVSDNVYAVEVKDDVAEFTLRGVKKTGYSLIGANLSGSWTNITKKEGETEEEKRTNGQDITLIVKGNTYKQNVSFVWNPDTYRICYAVNEQDTTGVSIDVTYDGDSTVATADQVPGVATSKPGYKFDHWKVDGIDAEIHPNVSIKNIPGLQEYLYEHPNAILKPQYIYNGIVFDKEQIRFEYRIEDIVGETVRGEYIDNKGNENFKYSIEVDPISIERLAEHGITAECRSGGIVFSTIAGGPLKTNSAGIDIAFEVIDNNVTDENAPEKHTIGYVKIIIDQCPVQVYANEVPNKIYDGETTCTNLPKELMVTAGGKIIQDAYVTYSSCYYDSPDAGERSIIIENPVLHFSNNEDPNNYILLKTDGVCYVDGHIDKRDVYVKTSTTNLYGRSYVRAGEVDNPQYTVIADDSRNTSGKGFVSEADAEILKDLSVSLKPERDDSQMSKENEIRTYEVWVATNDVTQTSNYNFILNAADESTIAKFDVKLEALTNDLYEIPAKANSEDWYGGAADIQLLPTDPGNYNMIRLQGSDNAVPVVNLTEENTPNNLITFRMENSNTGAYTAWRTITVKVDKKAPVYTTSTFEETGTNIPGKGLYFPGLRENVTFGNYFNNTVKFSVQYEDKPSLPKTLYYTFGGEALSVPFEILDRENGLAVAEFEILANAVDKIGEIQFWAEDRANNIETAKHTMTRNATGVWVVETTGPKIVSWNVKSGETSEVSVVSGSERFYTNCIAKLSVQDTSSGIHGVTWYINDVKLSDERVSVTTAKLDSYEFEKAIDTDVYFSKDGWYSVYAAVTDNAGNVSVTDKIEFKVDDTDPEVNILNNYDTYQQKVKLEFTTYDTLSGIQYIKVEDKNGVIDCTIEDAGKNEAGNDVSHCYMETVSKGTYYIEVADKAGNVVRKEIVLDKVSSEVPPCPQVVIAPDANENGWINSDTAMAMISNIIATQEDGTPVETKYQLWKDGETSMHVTTIAGKDAFEEVAVPNGIYKLRVWSESITGVLCSDSNEEGHVYTIQVDSEKPTIDYQLNKGTDNSLIVNFTVNDDISGVDGKTIQVMNGIHPVNAQITELEDGSGYTGSFKVTEVGNYTITVQDIAGNKAEAPAFKPMSMRVNAVKNISATTATVGARIYKGTYDIQSANILYRKFDSKEYIESETLPVLDDVTGDLSVSAVLDNLENGTNYVYKVTAMSEAGEMLEYLGYFRTLSDSEAGITVTGTVRYADGRADNVTVGLFAGNSCIRAVEVDTGENNTFTFSNVPDGNYRVVASDGEYTKNARVLIKDGRILYPDSDGIDLVLSGNNTSVEITTDETPDVTADNMNSLFNDITNYTEDDKLLVEEEDGTVEFKLYATLMKVSNVTSGEIAAMYSAASSNNKIVGAYIDLTLYKIVTDKYGNVSRTQVHKLGGGSNISVTIPLEDLANKSGLEVIRIHKNGDSFTGAYLMDQDNNPDTYTITTSQFSTYAVLYDPEKEPEKEPEKKPDKQPTTEQIKDGTLNPSDDGMIYQPTPDTEIEPDEEPANDKDDKKDKKEKDKQKDKENKPKKSTVGSLKSAGSAKTGDTTPLATVFIIMSMSIIGFVLLLRKEKNNNSKKLPK